MKENQSKKLGLLQEVEEVEYETLYQYIKEERPNDVKYSQAMLGGLSQPAMQKYF